MNQTHPLEYLSNSSKDEKNKICRMDLSEH